MLDQMVSGQTSATSCLSCDGGDGQFIGIRNQPQIHQLCTHEMHSHNEQSPIRTAQLIRFVNRHLWELVRHSVILTLRIYLVTLCCVLVINNERCDSFVIVDRL